MTARCRRLPAYIASEKLLPERDRAHVAIGIWAAGKVRVLRVEDRPTPRIGLLVHRAREHSREAGHHLDDGDHGGEIRGWRRPAAGNGHRPNTEAVGAGVGAGGSEAGAGAATVGGARREEVQQAAHAAQSTTLPRQARPGPARPCPSVPGPATSTPCDCCQALPCAPVPALPLADHAIPCRVTASLCDSTLTVARLAVPLYNAIGAHCIVSDFTARRPIVSRLQFEIRGTGEGLLQHAWAPPPILSDAQEDERRRIIAKTESKRSEDEKESLRRADCLRSLWLDSSLRPCVPQSVIRAALEGGARTEKAGGEVRANIIVDTTSFVFDEAALGSTPDEWARTLQFNAGVKVGQSRINRTRALFRCPWSVTVELDVEDLDNGSPLWTPPRSSAGSPSPAGASGSATGAPRSPGFTGASGYRHRVARRRWQLSASAGQAPLWSRSRPPGRRMRAGPQRRLRGDAISA